MDRPFKRSVYSWIERSAILDQQFMSALKTCSFPLASSETSLNQAGLSTSEALSIFKSQIASRQLDLLARQLKKENTGFYTLASSGHEGNAAIARVFSKKDMAFLHYRSGAFFFERAAEENLKAAWYHQVSALMCSGDNPLNQGRHKVFGAYELNIPPQTSTISSHLPKAVGVAFSIGLAKAMHYDSVLSPDSVVLCSFGESGINHSTAQGAFQSASWSVHHRIPLPIVFVCEDNGFGISMPTPNDWIQKSFEQKFGFEYRVCDGLNFCDVYLQAARARVFAYTHKKPVLLHFKTVRLLGHGGADVEIQYKSLSEIEKDEKQDPLLHSARILIENGILSAQDILDLYQQTAAQLKKYAQEPNCLKHLDSAQQIKSSIIPPKSNKKLPPITKAFLTIPNPNNMARGLNWVLAETLDRIKQAVILGEDVGKKGGVFQITADLQSHFGQARVFDTPLDEQTILGTSIGLALNGFLPIVEIQFFAYIHTAIDQIRGEAATLSFFSNGQYTNPMIIRVPSFAYQKGFGGNFHSENAWATLREIPGLIVVCPSNGADAVKLFRECVRLALVEQRVILFLEPIALYMKKEEYVYPKETENIPFGEPNIIGSGKDMVIISYGNGFCLAKEAAEILEKEYQIQTTLMDLRWLAPLNEKAILDLAVQFKRILVVDECKKTGSLSEQIMALLVDNQYPSDQMARITSEDSFIPLGPAGQKVLVQVEDIVEGAKILRK